MTAQLLNPEILYQDQDIVVVNKPPGVVVNDAQTTASLTIQTWLAEQPWQAAWPADWKAVVPADFDQSFGTPTDIFKSRQGVVHRLDKETSGVLVCAKHPGSLVALLQLFKTRQVQKTYLCLVHGRLKVPQAHITLPIARAKHDRLRFTVSPEGREATTEYRVLAQFTDLDRIGLAAHWLEAVPSEHQPRPLAPGMTRQKFQKLFDGYQGFSLVECQPRSGRTHQIRVHFSHLKHPLVADAVYGGKKRLKLDHLWCPRHFLHASQLQFLHPRTHQSLTIDAPLWPDLQQTLTYLR